LNGLSAQFGYQNSLATSGGQHDDGVVFLGPQMMPNGGNCLFLIRTQLHFHSPHVI
jgi:hypothetical protein